MLIEADRLRQRLKKRTRARQFALTPWGIRLIGPIARRILLMFFPNGVILVTTATRSRRAVLG
jgi:hypothetical protein